MASVIVWLLVQLAGGRPDTKGAAMLALSACVAGSNSFESPPALVRAVTRSSSINTVAKSPASVWECSWQVQKEADRNILQGVCIANAVEVGLTELEGPVDGIV